MFADVPCPSQYADWVGQLYQEGVTAGCGNNNFCPTDPLGSWQMLAWANKIWGSYYPLPRASVLTYRDEGARVTTEANQTSSSGDSSVVITYPRDNIFLGSQLVSSAVWSGTTPSYQFYAVDHLGTPRLVTNISAASVQTRKFWPYGDDGPTTGSDAGQRLKLAGMERDSENKHYYDHARTEDFNIGRFVSAEPAWQGAPNSPQSWNRYSVDNNNPVSFVDPDGAIPIPIAIALGGGLVNGAVGLLEYRSGHPTAGFWDQARRFGLDFATGFAGTLAAESGLFGEGALAAAIGSTLTSIGNQWVARESFSVADAALSGLLGATSFGVASHLGPRPGTFLAARWTNRSLSDFFTMTNVGKQTAVGLAGAGLEAESSLIASFPRLGGGGSASQNPLGEGYFYYQLFWFQFQQHYGNAPSGQPTQPYNPNVICVGVPDGKGKIHRVCQ